MFYVDHGITAKLLPNSAGEVTLVGDWFVHEDAVEGVDYDLDELIGLWDITHRQTSSSPTASSSGSAPASTRRRRTASATSPGSRVR